MAIGASWCRFYAVLFLEDFLTNTRTMTLPLADAACLWTLEIVMIEFIGLKVRHPYSEYLCILKAMEPIEWTSEQTNNQTPFSFRNHQT